MLSHYQQRRRGFKKSVAIIGPRQMIHEEIPPSVVEVGTAYNFPLSNMSISVLTFQFTLFYERTSISSTQIIRIRREAFRPGTIPTPH